MSFGGGRGAPMLTRRQRRLSRARWWFQCMRDVVERAIDWQPAPLPPPEQTWFPGARREVELSPVAPAVPASLEEQQVCE